VTLTKPFIRFAIVEVALTAAFVLMSPAAQAGTFSFQTLNNSGDTAFNQLLGINNAGTIVGYFGDGTVVPNNGYSLVPPATYTSENFPGSIQTQVVGINNISSPTTVGFWVDGNGNNFGFSKAGSTFTSFSDPNAAGATTTTQLLGVNNSNVAAGFYLDGTGNAHGFLLNTGTHAFASVTPPSSFGAISTFATGVNNAGIVSGYYTNAVGTHGFIENAGVFTSYNDPNGTDTMFFGLNDDGQVVGSFVNASGETEGLLFNLSTNNWQTISDPLASALNNGFNVNGTTVNGINDEGQLVGFYGDGTNVNGFLANPVPEPAPLGLMALGAALLGATRSLTKSTSA
jgi:hypothetical protein